MRIAGLFAGIGGFERGMAAAGHETELLCDVLPQSRAVLGARFPDATYVDGIARLVSLPRSVELVTAGFPCQDLSQAGRVAGLDGDQSSLIGEVLVLARVCARERRPLPTLVIENVPFMLRLNRGRAMLEIVDELQDIGYRWAYRTVDTWAFGLPQRRERVFLVASTELDPSAVLLSDDAPLQRPGNAFGELAHGFYWTEGLTGLGWAVDAVPTLKNGSTIGIASPPAIMMPDGRIVKPSIEDTEALQGFPRGWTAPAETVARSSSRWGLVGSAVSVPVAQWVGERLLAPGEYDLRRDRAFPATASLPRAARFDGRKRHVVEISTDPIGVRPPSLAHFLKGPLDPLSLRAIDGFYKRTRRAKLTFQPEFLRAVRAHIERMGGTLADTDPRLVAPAQRQATLPFAA